MSVNKAMLVGNLGADAEIKTTQNGKKFANCSLATSKSYKDKDGQRVEKTQWHRIVVWNEGAAGFLEQYGKKGAKIYVEGEIETRKWVTSDGQDRWTTEVVVHPYTGRIDMIVWPDKEDQGEASPKDQPAVNHPADLEDEVPF